MVEIYGTTGIVAGIAQTAFLATAFGLGAMLLKRARSSGDLHQRLLGWHLILAMGVGYLLLSIALASFELGIQMAPTLISWLVGLGNAGTIVGLWATLLFTRGVFRQEDRIADAAIWILSGMMLAGYLAYGVTGGFATARYENWGGAIMLLGITGTNVWVSYEPIRYYRMMRRRLKLGLAEPVVVNRLLLWGVGSTSRLVLLVVGVGATFVVRGVDPVTALFVSKLVLISTSLCGLVTSIAYWLAFHPSPAYLHWVERRAALRT